MRSDRPCVPSSQMVLVAIILAGHSVVASVGTGGADTDALRWLTDALDMSWTGNLTADPDGPANAPNRSPRSVKSGHYVLVEPTPEYCFTWSGFSATYRS